MTQEPKGKICSLLPSATEIVFALGLGDRLVGVTHECDYPLAARQLPVVTRSLLSHEVRDSRDIHRHISGALHQGSSLYVLDQNLLEQLDPDLILTQELCDVCAVSYELVEAPVLRRIEAVTRAVEGRTVRPRVLAVEWLDPLFTAGHWVPEMLRLTGGQAMGGVEGWPSTQITWPRVIEADPEIIVLMPCAFTLEHTLEEAAKVRFAEEWRRRAGGKLPRVYAVNGSAYFNRPGPRIVDGLEILLEIIHPDVAQARCKGTAWRPL